jgi:elongation factor G
MDYEPEEIKRNITIGAAFNHYIWKKHEVFLADTPGDDNFINESKYVARISDCALFCIGAATSVKNQTTKFTDFIEERKIPTIICITRMDRERANFAGVIQGIKENLPLKPAITYVPIGAEENFKGVVNVINQKAYMFDGKGKATETEIPADMADEIGGYRESLMEQVAETDDELIEKFLEEGELTDEDLLAGLKAGVRSGEISPVSVTAAFKNQGADLLLDMINDMLPSPGDCPSQVGTDPKSKDIAEREPKPAAPFSAQVFKTMADPFAGRLTIFRVYSGTLSGDTFYNSTKDVSERFGQIFIMEGKNQKPVDSVGPGMIAAVAKLKETVTGDTLCVESAPIIYEPLIPIPPVISYAVTAKKGDEEKLFSSITKMLDEDLTLQLTRELEVIGEKIKRKFGVEMELHTPKIPYMETLKGKARVQGKHKKQSGGRGQFADTWVEIEPLPRGGGYEFIDKIVGGAIPKTYIPAVDKGIQEAMEKGVLAGYPVVDVQARLVDGSFHAVDSSELAFKIAGSLAFKKAAQEANPVLLEPIMNIAIRVPEDCVGDVMGDLNSRRGRVMGMDSEAKNEVINAQVPMAEIQKYSGDLTSFTGGRGSFTVSFSHYEEVPAQLAEKIIEAAKKGE